MLFAIDIDGTVSGVNVRKFVYTCNERLSLGLDAKILDRVRTYQEFYELPEVGALRGDEVAWRHLRWIDFSSEILCSLPALPSAIDGVAQLARLGTVVYYTARKCRDDEKNREMAEATERWLEQHNFPGEAVFCLGVRDKLRRLALVEEAETIILIDDLYQRILEEIQEQEFEALRRHMILVAFGAVVSPACNGLQVHVLPSWRDIDRLVNCLQKGSTFMKKREDEVPETPKPEPPPETPKPEAAPETPKPEPNPYDNYDPRQDDKDK